MNIIGDLDDDFLITKRGQNIIEVNTGRVYWSKSTYFSTFILSSSNTFNETNNNAFNRKITSSSSTFYNIKENSKIYVQIDLGLSMNIPQSDESFTGILRIVDGGGTPVPEYFAEALGAVLSKRFDPLSANIIIQTEDPESETHNQEKNTDESITATDASLYSTWNAKTHILIGEVISGSDPSISILNRTDSLVVRQYHRGPLFLELPLIVWGDKQYRDAAPS